MYAYTSTHIHTHKRLFYCAVRNFYFDKKKARSYHSSERRFSVTHRLCV